MNNNGCIIPEINEQNIGVQQENATFLVIGDEAYTSEIIEEYNRNAAAKTEEFNTNATNKTNDFNTNYDNKLEAFNSNAVTKTEDFDSHVTAQTTNFNNNAETATVNFNKNAAQQTDEFNKNAMSYSQSIEENKKNIASTSNELYHLKTDILETGESSGNNIHLEDSAWAEMQEIKVDGVCEQNTTTGKNLLNVPKDLQQIKNDSYSITPFYSNGMLKYIELNGTFNAWTGYSILGAEFTLSPGTYVQSFHKEGTFSNGSVYIDSSLSITSIESDNFSKVLSDDLNVSKYKICVNEGTTCNNLKLYPMIAKENEVSNYEPFTNGASPSPDYPQEIKTITDSLKITSCNKNIFNFNETKNLKKYNCDYKYENDILELTQTSQWTYVSCDIKVKPNTTYVYSFEMDFEGINRPSNWWLSLNDTKGTTYNKNLVSFINDKIYKIFNTTNSNTLQILFTGSTTTIPTKTIFKNIQLEENPSLTDFEQNLLSKIEAKLPEGEFIGKINDTYKDTLRAEYNKDDGQYHLMLDKMIGKYTFTGNENWATYTQSNGIPIFRCTLPASGYSVKSNYFVSQTTWSTLLEENRIFNHVGNYQNIEIACSKFDTLTNFENFITTNVVQMYHGLATPYTLDLGAIDMPLTYDEITNIFTDSDLLPTINVKYYRNFITTIQNLQVNNDTLKNELSNIESRLTALESANTNIESRLTTLESANKNVADSNPTEESEVTE